MLVLLVTADCSGIWRVWARTSPFRLHFVGNAWHSRGTVAKTKASLKQEQIRVRLSAAEKRMLANAAQDSGLALASWVRWIALQAAKQQASR
jgi:hypothetical protein